MKFNLLLSLVLLFLTATLTTVLGEDLSENDLLIGQQSDNYPDEPLDDIDTEKRPNAYNFGLGKRAMGYNFGLGKRPQSMYSFGLGKRYTPSVYAMGKRPKEMYAFGLGKRSADDYYDNSIEDNGLYDGDMDKRKYAFGLGKRPMNYNFGLGKRPMSYNFGLGKRPMNYNFGLGKRSKNMYSFGLGKREVDNDQFVKSDEGGNVEATEKSSVVEEAGKPNELQHERTKRAAPSGLYSFGLGKRRPFDFGLGKRNRMYSFGVGKRDYEEVEDENLYE